jgi:hypothetical protein
LGSIGVTGETGAGRLHTVIEHDFEFGLGHVRLIGELDGATASTARSGILKCAADHPQAVIVDIDRVTVDQPRFLIVLAAAARGLSDDHIATIVVAHPGTPVGRSVRRELSHVLPIYDSRAAALAATMDAVPSPTRMHLHLPPLPTSPAVARSLVQYACGSWRLDRMADRARLIVSELVSNAVVHAGTELDVTVVLRGDLLFLQVRDRSVRLPRSPAPGMVSPRAEHGRGLHLVDSLATSWGSSAGPHGKTVWATIRVRPLA